MVDDFHRLGLVRLVSVNFIIIVRSGKKMQHLVFGNFHVYFMSVLNIA